MSGKATADKPPVSGKNAASMLEINGVEDWKTHKRLSMLAVSLPDSNQLFSL